MEGLAGNEHYTKIGNLRLLAAEIRANWWVLAGVSAIRGSIRFVRGTGVWVVSGV